MEQGLLKKMVADIITRVSRHSACTEFCMQHVASFILQRSMARAQRMHRGAVQGLCMCPSDLVRRLHAASLVCSQCGL
jgi:hypothetical protein